MNLIMWKLVKLELVIMILFLNEYLVCCKDNMYTHNY